MEPISNHPATLTVATVLDLLSDGGFSAPLQAAFLYDAADPYAVRLVLSTPQGPSTRLFGRELLVVGMVEPTGLGDIHVWPGVTALGEVVLIEFISGDDQTVLAARSSEVAAFLDSTFRLVGVGLETEHCDVDAMIAGVLGDMQGSTDEG